MQFVKPIPFKEAVEKIGTKTLVGADLSSSEWHDVPVALRERAFFSSRVESVRFLQRGRDTITDFLTGARETLPNGQVALKAGSRAEFVKQMSRFAIAEGMGPLDPKDAGTVKDIRSERRLGLIFSVQTQQADDFGAWKQGMDPDVLDAFPAQRFIRVVDVTERRQAHTPFEGEVRLKGDLPFWLAVNRDFNVPWGPWGWGCGHDVEDVDRAETERRGLLQPGQRVAPVEKDFNDRLEASTRGLDPDLLAKLREGFGDQVIIEGDTVRWNSQPGRKSPTATRPALDDLASEYSNANWSRRRELAEQARKAIEIPVQERGTVDLTAMTASPQIRDKARRGVEIVSRYTSAVLLRNTKIQVHALPGNRAYHLNGGIYINPKTTASTAAHEIMHGVEQQNPKVLRAAAEFLLRRAQGEAAQTLRTLTGDHGYDLSEIAFKDEWAKRAGSVYAGKIYSWFGAPKTAADIRATEVLTMGIERLHADPLEFYINDRDWFDFVVQTLKGL